MPAYHQIYLVLSCWMYCLAAAARVENNSCETIGKTWAVEHIIDIIQWDFSEVSQVNFCQERCREAALCVALTQRFLGEATMECILFRASIYYDSMVDCGGEYSGFYKCSR